MCVPVSLIDHSSSSSCHPRAPARRGAVQCSTRSEKARNPRLIWSLDAEKRIDAAMKVIASFFEYLVDPNVIDGDMSSATTTFSSRSAWVWRRYGALRRAVTFQSIRRTSSPLAIRPVLVEVEAGAAQRTGVRTDPQVADLLRGVHLEVAQLAHDVGRDHRRTALRDRHRRAALRAGWRRRGRSPSEP